MLKNSLKNIGVKEGQILLDFGCGPGNYTIPAAEIVGESSSVYAVEKDRDKLDKLKRKSQELYLDNIKFVNSNGGIKLNIDDEFFNIILLYDIFSYFGLSNSRLIDLLREMYRLLKQNGFMSVYPKHVNTEKLIKRITQSGFSFRDKYYGNLLHGGKFEKGTLLNFTKTCYHEN